MHETKSRLLYILLYLWQNTDAEHYATTGDILTYLKENGISCDRKTIPGDIAKLCDIGIDIIYQIVNLLIHRFHTLGNIDIPFQFFRLINACHL